MMFGGVGISQKVIVAPAAVGPAVPEPTAAPPPTPTPAATPAPAPATGATQAVPPSRAGPLTEDDQAAIYAAVVRQLYTVDDTFGGQGPDFPVIYIVQTTDDSVGDPNLPQLDSQPIPDAVRSAVTAALADLPAEIHWVAGRADVPLEQPGDRVKDGGVEMTLGNIQVQPDGSALVSAQLYFAMLGAGGRTYVLKQVDGKWAITGTTGAEWIS
jgi:hypothetical protein